MLVDSLADLILVKRLKIGKKRVYNLGKDATNSQRSEHIRVMHQTVLFFRRQRSVDLKKIIDDDVDDAESENDGNRGDPDLCLKRIVHICLRKVHNKRCDPNDSKRKYVHEA